MSPTVPPISVITTCGASPVGVGRGHGPDARLDLVGDVRNDLDGVAQVLAAALLVDHTRLRAAVFDPLRAALDGRKAMLIAPDGQLNLLPFETLLLASGRYLIDDYQVSYLTSGRDVLRFGMPKLRECSQDVVAWPTPPSISRRTLRSPHQPSLMRHAAKQPISTGDCVSGR